MKCRGATLASCVVYHFHHRVTICRSVCHGIEVGYALFCREIFFTFVNFIGVCWLRIILLRWDAFRGVSLGPIGKRFCNRHYSLLAIMTYRITHFNLMHLLFSLELKFPIVLHSNQSQSSWVKQNVHLSCYTLKPIVLHPADIPVGFENVHYSPAQFFVRLCESPRMLTV